MPRRERRRIGRSPAHNPHNQKSKPFTVCGMSLPLFLVLSFVGVVVCMYAYFFYAILTKGPSGPGPQVNTFREEQLVSASAAEQHSAQGQAGKSVAGRESLGTVSDLDMFRPLGDQATIHIEGGEDRIWYSGKEVYLEIGCTEEQFAAMSFEVFGPVQIVPERDIRSVPMADAFCGRVVSYTPTVPGQYTFVINDKSGALASTERFQRAFFHKVVDEKTFPRTHVAAVEQLRRHIHEIQNPPDCSKARLYLYNLNHGMNYGVGVNTEYMVAAFGAAMAANRTFVLPTKKNQEHGFGFYWADGTCESDSWMYVVGHVWSHIWLRSRLMCMMRALLAFLTAWRL